MEYIKYKSNQLYMESVSVETLLQQHETPIFLYSKAEINKNFQRFYDSVRENKDMVCYAVKANSHLSILNILASQGAGFDVVSKGELSRVIEAGGSPKKTIFSGVGKKANEIKYALENDIYCFNVESESELYRINQVAKELGKKAPISIRVNPDVNVETHPYISTGLKENKFGTDINSAEKLYIEANKLKNIHIKGVDCHIGSQILEIDPFIDAIDRLLILVDRVRKKGVMLSHINVGGGLGVVYNNEVAILPEDYVKAVTNRVEEHGDLKIIYEPGRAVVANAGLLITTVEFLKKSSSKNFAIVDAAMNDQLRPSLYNAWHNIAPIKLHQDVTSETYDVVGPICETGDFLGKDRELGIKEGDLLAIFSSGAYGFSMSSNYNSRPKVAEALIDGEKANIITRPEKTIELWRNEILLKE